jgi:predicted nuclease with TOPRIM domain
MEKNGMPIYVKIDEYKDILDVVDMMKHKIAETKEVLRRLNEIKNEEDSELEQWKSQLDEVERRIAFIDKTMFLPEPY